MPLLDVKNLYKSFTIRSTPFASKKKGQTVQALDNVSFCIHKGETLGLVGESGCGKTTLSKILLRFDAPDHGQVYYEGQDIHRVTRRRDKELRRLIQIVFQDPYGSLNPRMPIGHIIAEGIKIHHDDRKSDIRALTMRHLQDVGIDTDAVNRYPHEFSGGQRQRICIARALSVAPSLLILDEPVSSLDVSVQAGIMNLLADLQKKQGLTYLFISHDLSVVQHMSHRVMVMRQGQIVEEGAVDDIFERPQDPYTKRLLDSAFILDT